jgi:hypothetical protein
MSSGVSPVAYSIACELDCARSCVTRALYRLSEGSGRLI